MTQQNWSPCELLIRMLGSATFRMSELISLPSCQNFKLVTPKYVTEKVCFTKIFLLFYFGGWCKQLEFSMLKYLKIRRNIFILGCISIVTYTLIKYKINWWAIVRNGIKRERGSIHFKFKSYFSVYCWTHHLVDLYWCLFYRNKNVLMLFYWT